MFAAKRHVLRNARTALESSRRTFASVVEGPATPAKIPVIEFGKFLQGSERQRQDTANEIIDAFKNVGFVYLSEHGIPKDTSKKFFSLPGDVKDKLAWEDPRANRGYVAFGRERVTQSSDPEEIKKLRESAPDYKETMEIGRDFDSAWRNRWPKEEDCPKFKDTMNDFFLTCHNLQLSVMKSLAVGFRLDETFFDKLCNDQSHNLRLLSYPSVQKKLIEGGGNRAGSHSDYGTVTLLFQDMVGGLEVQDDKTKQFVPATPIPDTIVVNVGDLLSRWSNDVLRSTLHRVVLPQGASGSSEEMTPARQSIAFFSNPNMDTIVKCLPGLGEPRYEPVRTEEYLVRRLSETYT